MEMWWLGFYMDRFRLALFLALAFVVVVGLSYFEGGDETFQNRNAGCTRCLRSRLHGCRRDASAIRDHQAGMSVDEIVGKISLHAVPGSIGAILARRLLEVEETKKEKTTAAVVRRKNFSDGRGSNFPGFPTCADRRNGADRTPDDGMARGRAGPCFPVRDAGLHLFS